MGEIWRRRVSTVLDVVVNHTTFVKKFDAGKKGMEPFLGVMFSDFYGDQLPVVSPG